jgi:fumarate hydratase class II
MGDVYVPEGALWGAQTQRAVENFPISGRAVEPALVHALALIKQVAAEVNAARSARSTESVGAAIVAAAAEVAAGEHDDEFPVDVFQTGSGTSTNMNVNEVLATLATARSAGRSGRTTRSTPHSPRTTRSPPRSISLPRAAS